MKCLSRICSNIVFEKMSSKSSMISIRIDVKIDTKESVFFDSKQNLKPTHNYGPFTVKMPKNLSIKDIYKFAMYTLLTHNKFGMQSGEFISAIGCQYTILDKKFFIKQKMGVLKFESFLLNKQRPITTHAENSCVIDYVWDQVKGKRGFKTYTYEKLKNEIYKYVNGTMINTEELINWTKDCHSNVSIHAFDSRYRKFIAHNNNCSNVTLVYVVKDNHCFPITEKETYKVCTNMPVIAITNIKDKQIFNSMEFVIQEIKNNNFKVNNEWYDKKQFSETFIPGFCVTVYKYQGAEINEPYNIYDFDRMDKKELYTALSRTTKLEYIHLNYKKLKNQYFNRKLPTIELISNVHNSYNNGKIYQITFDNIYIYIGSTCETLETRLKWHLTNTKSQVFKHRHNNPKIELITNAPSFNKSSLVNVENGYIAEYAEKYGERLLNVRSNPIKKKKIEYSAQIETEAQLKARIAKLENKLKIKD